MKKVAVLGGGMAGLTAAWRLSEADCRDDFAVTVYQRGWRLGGKGASSRGRHGRIEEHGLHVWLGYYDNAFRLIRDVYTELDRPETDPTCPIRTWQDGFSPAGQVGVGDLRDGTWSDWLATFQPNAGVPGTARPEEPSAMTARFVRRGLGLLADFSASLNKSTGSPGGGGTALLSASPKPPGRGSPAVVANLDRWLRQAALVSGVGAGEALRLAERAAGDSRSRNFVLDRLRQLSQQFDAATERSHHLRRSCDLANLVIACLTGTVRDNLISDPSGFAAVDHLDFRAWLQGHGATERTLQSPMLRGMYDLVFAYEEGDVSRPRFPAGLGLLLASRMFFDYQGSIFWHMRAGMGDVVFAPLYQALHRRGVRFEFFHRLDNLSLSPDRARLASITLGRQATSVCDGDYEPLVRVEGLPCYPSVPRTDQLAGEVATDLESHWSERSGETEVQLEQGVDFDSAVLATSLGMVPHVAGELLRDSPRWRDMVSRVATVPTQALQVWLRSSEADLGWPHRGSTVSGYSAPFDTYASMSHVIPRESWPREDGVQTAAYFCGVLEKAAALDPSAAHELVRSNALHFLTGGAKHFWPHSRTSDGGFRWDLLVSSSECGSEAALSSQYWRANVDPSDQYVQSLPGSGASRLQANESGYSNLFLAGDWINCGLNAGCIEAAVMAGVQAANAVRERPLTDGLLGEWYGLRS